jgi:2'-5' RNA ligase
MDGCNGAGRLNSFALVGYLPDPIGRFVNQLRRELVPQCSARAHVTILPPRPLACSADSAWRELRQRLAGEPPIQIELREVKLFPASDVIYISIGYGYEELERLHRKLANGHCLFNEAWRYHPHITLAQQLDPTGVAASLDLAVHRWNEFKSARCLALDHLTWVQNTWENDWQDLEQFDLQAVSSHA